MSRKPPKVTNAPGITWHKRRDGQWKAVWRARTDLIKKGYKFKSIGVWVGTPEELDANNIHWIQTRANDLQIDMLAWGRGEVPRLEPEDRAALWPYIERNIEQHQRSG